MCKNRNKYSKLPLLSIILIAMLTFKITPITAKAETLNNVSSNNQSSTAKIEDALVTPEKGWKMFENVNSKKIEGTDIVAKCEVNVISNEDIIKAERVTLDKKAIELLKGTVDKIETTILPKNSTNTKLIWASSDENIVKVDENGNVTAIKEGNAKITVRIDGTDKKDSCDVIVKNSEAILLLTLTDGSIKEYEVTMKEVNKFIKWYEDKTEGIAGVEPDVYSFYKTVKEYIEYNRIYLFEYREY
ncbi:Ig-like domain-containing protein [Clostridium gasigenes]|uniref:Ig-like domain-containing protein n=1 Tax=Clostridium gasigenes TaxID=94869 RepID=UPI001C0C06AC|nr:Ig-like domain-containing protein [Clostridium gasigenes]MBU3107471.1 Ig-like domain-containing protein [Clostridium gasigenes]